MRTLALLAMVVSFAAASPAQEPARMGPFEVRLDAENAFLPVSIRWMRGEGIELLDSKTGLNLSFTDFEFRNKFYREENRNIWSPRPDPRFAVEPRDVQIPRALTAEGGMAGVEVSYAASYGVVTRRLLADENEARLRIEYAVQAGRDLVIHEPAMFGANVRFHEGFAQRVIPDARAAGAALTEEGKDAARYTLSLLYGGPAVVRNAAADVSVLISGAVGGDIPQPVPVGLLRLAQGQRLSLSLDLVCIAGDHARALALLAEARKGMGGELTPFLLVENALVLRTADPKAAEAALLQAAAMNEEYATPYALLAALRRDTKTPGPPSQTEAWVEAAYRMPYNYGYILSGSGFPDDPRLTEEQRRLAVFNLIIAVENTAFYPDYYIWAARPFEKMGLSVQACAMYRQALWALDHLPRPEDYKAKLRQKFEARIAELEKRLLTEVSPALPPLVPVRAATKGEGR